MKGLFFVRHYNDVDHIVPVIHTWARAGHECDVVIIGSPSLLDDFRVRHVASLVGVRVASIDQILSRRQWLRMRSEIFLLNRHVRRFVPQKLMIHPGKTLEDGQGGKFWIELTHTLLDRSFGDATRGVVAFDWVTSNSVIPIEWVRHVLTTAQARGIGTVSLPHGDSPHWNQLIRSSELKPEPASKFSSSKMFDRLVVPNELCAGRYRPFLEPTKIAVLGSPRYCDKWLETLSTLLPDTPLKGSPKKLKILLLLRKSEFAVFWEEVERVVRMISSFEDVELIIKAHTRSGWKQPLSRNRALGKLSNVQFVGDEIHSAHLLNWSDAVIDLATSVSFEAVKVGKPVLAADYLHASRSTVAAYMPECEIRCRDEIYHHIEGFLERGCETFYDTKNRERFLTEIIDGPSPEVLPRYLSLLEGLAGGHLQSEIL